MTDLRLLLQAGLVGVLGLAGPGAPGPPPRAPPVAGPSASPEPFRIAAPSSDARRARTLWLRALRREARLDGAGSLDLLRRARRAGPDFFPAQHAYVEAMLRRGAVAELRSEYDSLAAERGDRLHRCIAAYVSAPPGYTQAAVPRLLELERAAGPGPCTRAYLSLVGPELTPAGAWRDDRLGWGRSAVALAPEIGNVWLAYATALREAGRPEAAATALRSALPRVVAPVQRVRLYLRLAVLREARGAAPAAADLRRVVAAAAARHATPRLRWEFPGFFGDPEDETPPWEHRYRERVRIARSAGAWEFELGPLWGLGSRLGDGGNPAAAAPVLDRAVAIADRVGLPALRATALRFRGRNRLKSGDRERAERDLRRALAVGSASGDPLLLAEIHHNLAHLHEAGGRLAEASRAAGRFVALTRGLPHAQQRMMSLRDAGLIRWKAGWHAAARAALDEMVDVVRRQGRHNYWAGEHLERVGDLPAALEFYRRGLASDARERSLNLGGLVRVYEALGMADSAAAAARRHDRLLSGGANQLDVPLLPRVLAREGRTREAVSIARSWSDRQAAQGNLRGATLAALEAAGLAVRGGDPRAAAGLASRAEELAGRLNLRQERIAALRLRGTAAVRSGRTDAGLALLRDAARLAEGTPTATELFRTHLALGRALREAGRTGDAVEALDRAARAVESGTRHLKEDLARARFRERHLAPYDEAVLTLLGEAGTLSAPDRVDRLLAWSQRRKAAALPAARGAEGRSGRDPSRGAVRPVSLAALQGALGGGEALLDYTVIGPWVVLAVVTDGSARVLRLGADGEDLARRIDALRTPLTAVRGGRLDIRRAVFREDLAAGLFRDLLGPLAGELPGLTRLWVAPDGPLHALPFGVLLPPVPARSPGPTAGSAPPGRGEVGDGASGGGDRPGAPRATFLLELMEIAYLPSARFLREPVARRATAPGPERVLALAGAVPGAGPELRALRRAWSGRPMTVLTGGEATETALRRSAPAASVLHLAVHATADPADPLASHLRVEPDGAHDGYLHVGEIGDLPIRARLVVLSACESLAGRVYRGEGPLGLARAFLAAGAEAVVATHWPVGPAAAPLMDAFHRQVARGADPGRALRAARLRVRRDPETAHPFYWGGFVVVHRAGAAPPGTSLPPRGAGTGG